MKKDCPYIFLPTEKASNIFSYKDRPDVLFFQLNREMTWVANHFHLYILSDEKPKDGDWVLSVDEVWKYKYNSEDGNILSSDDKKIIASTNPELHKVEICKCNIPLKDRVKNTCLDRCLVCNKRIEGTFEENYVAQITQLNIEYCMYKYNRKEKEVDVDGLAKEYIKDIKCENVSDKINDTIKAFSFDAFEQGFKTNSDKKFTLEDMRRAFFDGGIDLSSDKEDEVQFKEFMQSLTKEKPKKDTVTVEYESNIEQIGSEEDELFERPKLKDGNIIIVRE